MEPKEFLNQVRLLDTRIQSRIEELEMLNALATKITSSFRPDPASGSGVSDRVGSCVAKIVDMENDIRDQVAEFMDLKRRVLAVLDEVTDPVQLQILHLHYCRYMSWDQIGLAVGYERRNVCYIHGRALQTVGEILKRNAAG